MGKEPQGLQLGLLNHCEDRLMRMMPRVSVSVKGGW